MQQTVFIWFSVVLATSYLVWVLKDSHTPVISDLRAQLQLPTNNPFVAGLQALSECPACLSFWCAFALLAVSQFDGGFIAMFLAAARAASWLYAFMEDHQ